MVQQAVVGGQNAQTLFSSVDMSWHSALRRAVNPYFTTAASADYESSIDKTIEHFLDQIDARFAGKGLEGVFDLADWFLYFAMDVIGELTYSSRFGFVESGGDIRDILKDMFDFADYGAIVRSPQKFPIVNKGYLTLPDGAILLLGQISPP